MTAEAPPSICGDVRLAWTLAQANPRQQQALRDRLREYIGVLAGPAEAYADSLAGEWHERVVRHGIASARKVAAGNVDPAVLPDEELLLLAEHIKTLLLYGRQAANL
ncbi:hypothetical protein ACH41E_30090 [Streptomyces sp. NPDC020412]|uniref:hypothetical protein n=1 Tax=Streptomyces sp. NPDC020412 TaxID=3365073 RepID=UPI0037BCEA31